MRRPIAPVLLALALVATGSLPADAQAPPGGLRILSREGTRTLPIVSQGNQEYVALDDLVPMFGLSVREDRLAGGLTIAGSNNRPVIVTPNQPIVSVAGRLVSLGTAPIRQGTRWLLPLDFLQRALGPALDRRMELRRASRLLIVGDIRVPRVTARAEASGPGETVVIDATPATPMRVAAEQGRLAVVFEADALDLAIAAVTPNDFIQAIQPGDAPAVLRIIPGPKFGVHRATSSQPDAGTARLTIELLPAGTEPPAGAPAAPAPAPGEPTEAPLPPPSPPPGVRTVVIDPGHGGDDAGVRGPGGTLEKDVTLAIARRLRTMIEGRLGLRVFLTRDDDRGLTLDDRAAYANSQRADVFISIHANGGLQPEMKGARVYYLSPEQATTADGGVADVLPALGGGTRRIDLLPWDNAQGRSLDASATLAGMIEDTLAQRVDVADRAVQQAPLRVLVGATMPAVLVEVGYLSNPEQEKALASGAYQDRVAQALFDAIVQFRAYVARQGQAAPAGPQR